MISLASRVFDPKVYNLTDTLIFTDPVGFPNLNVKQVQGWRELLYDSDLCRSMTSELHMVLMTFHLRMRNEVICKFPVI